MKHKTSLAERTRAVRHRSRAAVQYVILDASGRKVGWADGRVRGWILSQCERAHGPCIAVALDADRNPQFVDILPSR